MDKIFDISPVDRPFCDATSVGEAGNTQKDWVRESLAAANPQNKRIDGSSSDGLNDTVLGERLSNYHQISSKTVRVSDRARNSNTVDTSDELIRQLTKRQKEVRRDEEAAYVSKNTAIAGNGTTVEGQLAGVGSWIGVKVLNAASTTSDRGAGGADPVLSNDATGDGGFPVTAAVAGTARPWSETVTKNMMRESYLQGGNPTIAMSTPQSIEIISDYLFTSSARIATLRTETSASNRTDNGTGGGRSGGGVTAQGAVNILVTNFGTLELVPNRFQPEVSAGVSDLYLLDPDTWERCYLQGYETKELARNGLAENREITVDYSLIALNPEANAIVADIDTTAAGVV